MKKKDKKICILRSRKTKTRKSKTLSQMYSLSSKELTNIKATETRKYYYKQLDKLTRVRVCVSDECGRARYRPALVTHLLPSPLLCSRIFLSLVYLACTSTPLYVRTTTKKQWNSVFSFLFSLSIVSIDWNVERSYLEFE